MLFLNSTIESKLFYILRIIYFASFCNILISSWKTTSAVPKVWHSTVTSPKIWQFSSDVVPKVWQFSAYGIRSVFVSREHIAIQTTIDNQKDIRIFVALIEVYINLMQIQTLFFIYCITCVVRSTVSACIIPDVSQAI